MASKKSLRKEEIKNILDKSWDQRRQKNKERSRKGSELTKKWKKQEAALKELLQFQKDANIKNAEINKSRRPNYITTPDPES